MSDLSLDLQACYEYESFEKADGIEALVMGYPIPPYFAVSTSLLLSGAYLLRDSLCYGRSAVIKTKSRYFCNFFAISSSLSPHAKQESDVSWQITCAFAP